MSAASPERQPLLNNRLDVHDRRQFELKLEYEPNRGEDADYVIEAFFFLPTSLNVTPETYPREDFYADIHNYVRLKTPVLSFREMMTEESSPLVKLEQLLLALPCPDEVELVYQAKMLSCVLRGALRRFGAGVGEFCAPGRCEGLNSEQTERLSVLGHAASSQSSEVLRRFRTFQQQINHRPQLQERTRATLRLVDEYMSLSVEQFFRRAVADMERLPKTAFISELRKDLLVEVIREETYRKEHQLRSVISPTGDNEEYMHRIGFLKKFCMNILFLDARRDSRQTLWTAEVFLGIAAAIAMAFNVSISVIAALRFSQVSLNFTLCIIFAYALRDRLKEGLRALAKKMTAKHLFDRATVILDPVTKEKIGVLKEKVDYGAAVKLPDDIAALRRQDDFLTVTQGELSETIIRYQKKIGLEKNLLTRMPNGSTGVTDIIRINVDRLTRDMDNPEFALEYVDAEDLSVGRVRAAKSYQVDLAFRFTVVQDKHRRTTTQAVRLVLDRDGIKRMLPLGPAREHKEVLRVVAA